MVRKLSVFLLPLLLLFFVSTVSAMEDATTPSVRPTISVTPKSNVQEKNLLLDHKKNAIAQIKNDAKAAIQAKRNEFKEHLQTIKDQRKKLLVERIDTKIAQVNKKSTDKFLAVLTKLQALLDKINKASSNAKVLADIQAARAAIDTAKAAVSAQAEKIYTAQVTDETVLKINVGTTVSQFRQDLVAVHKLVLDAKQAVQKLNTDRELIKKEATHSANL